MEQIQEEPEPLLPEIFGELMTRWKNGEISYEEAVDIYTKIAYEVTIAKEEETT